MFKTIKPGRDNLNLWSTIEASCDSESTSFHWKESVQINLEQFLQPVTLDECPLVLISTLERQTIVKQRQEIIVRETCTESETFRMYEHPAGCGT